MKKNRKYLGLLILLLLTVVTSYAASSTYAKYTSQVSGSDSARVAKWAWKINNTDVNLGTATFTMNSLFDNSELYDTNASGNCDTAKENDVTSTDTVVAPGTCGKFAITIQNASEVAATYAYTLSATTTLPLEYSLDNSTWTSNISSLNPNGTLQPGATSSAVTVYWRWAYERSSKDSEDTNLGIAGTATASVTANITLTQVN